MLGVGCLIRLIYEVDTKMYLSFTVVILPSKVYEATSTIFLTITLLRIPVLDSTISMLLGAR